MIHPAVSDLFFNHEHEALDKVNAAAALNKEPATLGDTAEAILIDARDFVKSYGDIIIDCPYPEELSRDFMRRY